MKKKISSFINRIPEFSDKNFTLAGYVCGALVTMSSVFFIYEMFTTEDFGISVQWNIFKSKWFSPLCIVGLLFAILNWGKFGHWSFKTVNVYEDRHGNRHEEESNDMGDTMMGGCIMPLLGHFIIEPIIYACIIYYPLMCVFALLGIILPYAIVLVLAGIAVGVFMCGRYASSLRYHSLILLLSTILIAGGLTWVSVNMEQAKTPTELQFDAAPEQIMENNEGGMFDNQDSDSQLPSDEMFNDN